MGTDAFGCSVFKTLLLETGFGTPNLSFTDGLGGGTFSCLPCIQEVDQYQERNYVRNEGF